MISPVNIQNVVESLPAPAGNYRICSRIIRIIGGQFTKIVQLKLSEILSGQGTVYVHVKEVFRSLSVKISVTEPQPLLIIPASHLQN